MHFSTFSLFYTWWAITKCSCYAGFFTMDPFSSKWIHFLVKIANFNLNVLRFLGRIHSVLTWEFITISSFLMIVFRMPGISTTFNCQAFIWSTMEFYRFMPSLLHSCRLSRFFLHNFQSFNIFFWSFVYFSKGPKLCQKTHWKMVNLYFWPFLIVKNQNIWIFAPKF